ncbi:xylose isomerase [Sphingobium sp. TomTYG75]|jgi:sugar phosphate isomerase/epimerase
MRPLCLDHLSLYDVTALELIKVAAELGCDAVSLFVTPTPLGPYRDLTTDRAAKAEVLAALRDTGLSVGIVEPFLLEPNTDWDLLKRSAALAAELNGTVNALCFDEEPVRLQASFGRLAEIARAAGARMAIEGFTLSTVRTPADALAMADTVGQEIGLTIDTLHIIRTGGSWADLAILPQDRIFHVQINDGPRKAPSDLRTEATVARLPPGQGEFDIASFIPLVPLTALLAVEAPFRAPTGMPLERARTMVKATRALMA